MEILETLSRSRGIATGQVVSAGRSPLNFMFQKPSGICAAKRLSYNDRKTVSECSEKNCLWNAGVAPPCMMFWGTCTSRFCPRPDRPGDPLHRYTFSA